VSRRLPQLAPGAPADRKGIQSVEIGMRVLDAVARAHGALPLKEVSQAAGLSASQAHRYLASLMRSGMVVQDGATGQYDLGSAALRLGLAALGRIDASQLVSDALRRLVEHRDVAATVSVWGEQGPVLIRWHRSSKLIVAGMAIGAVFPLLTSATGLVLLAHLPPRITRDHLNAELKRYGGADRREELARLPGRLEEIRRNGYSQAEGHYLPGIWAGAAPVLDSYGDPVLVASVIDSAQRPAAPTELLIRDMMEVCGDVSAKIGGSLPAAARPVKAAAP
jgi:DNA-binding IclR family transcriptional regulator